MALPNDYSFGTFLNERLPLVNYANCVHQCRHPPQPDPPAPEFLEVVFGIFLLMCFVRIMYECRVAFTVQVVSLTVVGWICFYEMPRQCGCDTDATTLFDGVATVWSTTKNCVLGHSDKPVMCLGVCTLRNGHRSLAAQSYLGCLKAFKAIGPPCELGAANACDGFAAYKR
ncbi:hypothetical protein T484DRAFT_1881179 [Baffinella frigidus]|nr:hypothetical protein T484DRAFT_1881179 [Cryptophyta sp. CCMP2293]